MSYKIQELNFQYQAVQRLGKNGSDWRSSPSSVKASIFTGPTFGRYWRFKIEFV